MKAEIRTWYDVVKDLKKENESDTIDSVKCFDSDEPNYMKDGRANQGVECGTR